MAAVAVIGGHGVAGDVGATTEEWCQPAHGGLAVTWRDGDVSRRIGHRAGCRVTRCRRRGITNAVGGNDGDGVGHAVGESRDRAGEQLRRTGEAATVAVIGGSGVAGESAAAITNGSAPTNRHGLWRCRDGDGLRLARDVVARQDGTGRRDRSGVALSVMSDHANDIGSGRLQTRYFARGCRNPAVRDRSAAAREIHGGYIGVDRKSAIRRWDIPTNSDRRRRRRQVNVGGGTRAIGNSHGVGPERGLRRTDGICRGDGEGVGRCGFEVGNNAARRSGRAGEVSG